MMSASQDAIMRGTVPVELQGRVYACRNTLQFFTIPIGLLLGGLMVDALCGPYMAGGAPTWLVRLIGGEASAGASLSMLVLGVAGTLLCLVARHWLKRYHYCDTAIG